MFCFVSDGNNVNIGIRRKAIEPGKMLIFPSKAMKEKNVEAYS